jgi:hypothetical protein
LCGTSCTFLSKSGFSFFDAAIQLRIYARSRELETRFTMSNSAAKVAGAKTTRAVGVTARVYDTACLI